MKSPQIDKNKNKVYPEQSRRVFVAVSGGVDSSVSAALLVEQGYDVTGVFIKAWYPSWLTCSWKDERRDAMRVCAKLKIPFLTFDLESEYKSKVIDYMIAEYKKGRTPNPDVMCNRTIKFGAFFKRARKMGADYIATGHYARLHREFSNLKSQFSKKSQTQKNKKMEIGNWKLEIACDSKKDQSYFLWTLTQKELKHTLFPIGDLEKKNVRKLAKKFGLITAEKKESQGLCFVGKFNFRDFLKKYIKEEKGKVINGGGEVVGTHNGILFFTIGQRHGFEITEKSTDRKPYYIVAKDIKKNILIVSHKKSESKSFKKEVLIKDVNWISDNPLRCPTPKWEKTYKARIRYRQELQSCRINQPRAGKIKVIFNKPQRAVAPGQSLVIYNGLVCLGGGVIV